MSQGGGGIRQPTSKLKESRGPVPDPETTLRGLWGPGIYSTVFL